MMIKINGYEVYLGSDLGADNYTINIPELKVFKCYNIKKNAIATLENKAREIIEKKALM